MKNATTLKDALYNLSPKSGASVDYARGVLIGAFAALMATGQTFANAARTIRDNLPADYRPETIPTGYAGRDALNLPNVGIMADAAR